MHECKWCSGEFEPAGRGGSEQEFCCGKCRARFHKAARRYTEALIKSGFLTPRTLRKWHDASVYGEETT